MAATAGPVFKRSPQSSCRSPGLPFANVLSAERIERIFAHHGNLFGKAAIYSTTVVVWAFLSQVLRAGKQASCQAAVAQIVAYRAQLGETAPTEDTGDNWPKAASSRKRNCWAACSPSTAAEPVGLTPRRSPSNWK